MSDFDQDCRKSDEIYEILTYCEINDITDITPPLEEMAKMDHSELDQLKKKIKFDQEKEREDLNNKLRKVKEHINPGLTYQYTDSIDDLRSLLKKETEPLREHQQNIKERHAKILSRLSTVTLSHVVTYKGVYGDRDVDSDIDSVFGSIQEFRDFLQVLSTENIDIDKLLKDGSNDSFVSIELTHACFLLLAGRGRFPYRYLRNEIDFFVSYEADVAESWIHLLIYIADRLISQGYRRLTDVPEDTVKEINQLFVSAERTEYSCTPEQVRDVEFRKAHPDLITPQLWDFYQTYEKREFKREISTCTLL